jgi:hypothetical protein
MIMFYVLIIVDALEKVKNDMDTVIPPAPDGGTPILSMLGT